MSDEKERKGFWSLLRSKSLAVRNGKLVSENSYVHIDESVSTNRL